MEAGAVPKHADGELRCSECGARPSLVQSDFRCQGCQGLLEVVYPAWQSAGEVSQSGDALKRIWRERRVSDSEIDRSGVWRFRELLPILNRTEQAVTLREGNTPLYDLTQSARRLGMKMLLAKHQGMNPTGSFKDTGMTAALSVAREQGYKWVVCASTGNTSASMAAYAARAGLRALVVIPDGKIAWGKLSQALEYGATTIQLRTDFDGCMRIVTEMVRRIHIYLLNSINPYRLEGQKTAAVELLEQLRWDVPDHLIVPGGNLGNCSALGKGLREMLQLGIIDRLPKLSVIQAAGANPLYTSISQYGGHKLVPVPAETMATAIRIGNPTSWKKAVRVLEESGGKCEQVCEEEIALAKAEIGAEGLGCEPASAVALAGLKKLRQNGFVAADESAVLILTGHVLKDPEYSFKFHSGDLFASHGAELDALRRPPIKLDPDVDSILARLDLEDHA